MLNSQKSPLMLNYSNLYKKKKTKSDAVIVADGNPVNEGGLLSNMGQGGEKKQQQSNRYAEVEEPGMQRAASPDKKQPVGRPENAGISSKKQDNFFSLFGDTMNEGNLEYINNLVSKNKTQTHKDTSSSKVKPGHQRTKSNNLEKGATTSNAGLITTKEPPAKLTLFDSLAAKTERIPKVSESKPKAEPNEKPKPSHGENQSFYLFGGAGAGKYAQQSIGNGLPRFEDAAANLETPKLEGSQKITEVENEFSVESTVKPAEKEDRRFFDRLVNANPKFNGAGGAKILKKSISMEDLRKEKVAEWSNDLAEDDDSNYYHHGTGTHNVNMTIGNPTVSTKPTLTTDLVFRGFSSGSQGKDFMNVLDNILDYFHNSTAESEELLEKFHNDRHSRKSVALLQKELLASNNEVKALRQHIEKLEQKFNELNISKKLLLHELNSLRAREEEAKVSMKGRGQDQEVARLKAKVKELKLKLHHTQELLAKEKIDNENSSLALKKVLYSNFVGNNENLMFDSKVSQLIGVRGGPTANNPNSRNPTRAMMSPIDENVYLGDFHEKTNSQGQHHQLKSKDRITATNTTSSNNNTNKRGINSILVEETNQNLNRLQQPQIKKFDPRYYEVSSYMMKQNPNIVVSDDDDEEASLQSEPSSELDISYEGNSHAISRGDHNNYFQKHFENAKPSRGGIVDRNIDVMDTSELLNSPPTTNGASHFGNLIGHSNNVIFQTKGSQPTAGSRKQKVKHSKLDEMNDYGQEDALSIGDNDGSAYLPHHYGGIKGITGNKMMQNNLYYIDGSKITGQTMGLPGELQSEKFFDQKRKPIK